MFKARGKNELVSLVNQIETKSFCRGFNTGDTVKVAGISFGDKHREGLKYDFINNHVLVEYTSEQGEPIIIDVKAPRIISNIWMKARAYLEDKFNDSFLVEETREEAVRREYATLEKLNKAGFTTLEPLQDLLETSLDDSVSQQTLLTRAIQNPNYVVDILRSPSKTLKLSTIAQVATKMKTMHDLGVIWGDATLLNAMYDGNELLLHNFSLAPNMNKPTEFLQGKDLIQLCLSSVYRSDLPPIDVVPVVMDNYGVTPELREHLEEKLLQEINEHISWSQKTVRQKLFYSPVTMLKTEQVKDVKREVIRYFYK